MAERAGSGGKSPEPAAAGPRTDGSAGLEDLRAPRAQDAPERRAVARGGREDDGQRAHQALDARVGGRGGDPPDLAARQLLDEAQSRPGRGRYSCVRLSSVERRSSEASSRGVASARNAERRSEASALSRASRSWRNTRSRSPVGADVDLDADPADHAAALVADRGGVQPAPERRPVGRGG